MTYNIGEISLEELNALALAMDYLICNSNLPRDVHEMAEALFYTLDIMAEEASECVSGKALVEKTDNLLVVDFRPKD